MPDGQDLENTALEAQRAAQSHVVGSMPEHVAAAQAIRLLWPGMSSAAIAAELNGKVTAGAIRQWRNGIRPIPAWVCDHMRARAEMLLQAVNRIRPGKGKAAGARALAAWRASRNR